jgi:hypothetical protein
VNNYTSLNLPVACSPVRVNSYTLMDVPLAAVPLAAVPLAAVERTAEGVTFGRSLQSE